MVKSLAHEAIYDVVEDILKPLPRAELLDVPAGEGALASRLLDLGFNVHCCDLYPEMFKVPGIEIKHGDLNGTLPYENERFEYIVCVEGLEHIENPHQAFREFSRIIRPGGQLVASVPNILNIEERMKWLLSGYTSHFKPLSRLHLEQVKQEFGGREEVALHVNPIGYSELRYVMANNGFQIVRLYRDRAKKNLWAYWPIVGLIRLLNRLQSDERSEERWATELASDEILLGGNTLVVHAVKA